MMDPRTASVPSSDLASDVTVLPNDAPSAVETVAASAAPSLDGGLDETLVGGGDETLAASSSTSLASPRPDGTLVGRTTVLPKVVTEDAGRLRLETHTRSRYTPQRRLGAGAMGEVELSEDHDIGRPVALKRLSAGHESPTAVARFVDEVRTMGLLDHPNITPIYDVGRDDEGRLFFTMKYVEGESLESLIERLAAGDLDAHAQYPIGRRLDIFVGILHALDYAHAQSILHRDIKPANVMLGVHGEVRLMDWGIARRGERPALAAGEAQTASSRPDMTQDGALLGTPLYMSPEQARGDHGAIDARSDLYSAFVVLFELLTLRRYVKEDENLYATLQEVMEGKSEAWGDPDAWVHPHQIAIPVEYRYFLYQGLRRDPEQRFQTATEIAAALERARSGEIDAVCPITFYKAQQHRVTSFADAKPQAFITMMVAAGVGLLGLLALAGLGVATLV